MVVNEWPEVPENRSVAEMWVAHVLKVEKLNLGLCCIILCSIRSL